MMEVFENQEFGSIRVLQEAGKTFFCASDVAKVLGYVNPYNDPLAYTDLILNSKLNVLFE
jgi:prophage antirepressor-like protein